MCLLRRLRKFDMSPRILSSFSSCVAASILSSCIIVRYGTAANGWIWLQTGIGGKRTYTVLGVHQVLSIYSMTCISVMLMLGVSVLAVCGCWTCPRWWILNPLWRTTSQQSAGHGIWTCSVSRMSMMSLKAPVPLLESVCSLTPWLF